LPPTLALSFCTGFVLYLLWLEHKQFSDVSPASWIPTIWMLYSASRPIGAWFYSSGPSPESSPLDRFFLIALLCVALLILKGRTFPWSRAIKDNSPLIVLLIFMLISVLWSGIPLTSFVRWVREFQAVIMAFVVLSERSPQQAISSILRRTAYILVPFSVLLIKYFPAYGVAYGRWTGEPWWIGVTQQKNGLGLLCFVSAFYLIWSLTTRWQAKRPPVFKFEVHTELFVLVLVAWLMRGPQGSFFYSATSFYSLLVGLLCMFGLKVTKKYKFSRSAKALMSVVSLIYIFGIVYFFSGGSQLGFLATAAGRDATLTGRAEVWASLVPVAMRSPLLGMGFGGFWTPATQKLFRISGAHSGYLDLLLALGFVGLVMVLIFLLSSCRKANRALALDFDWGILWISMIMMTVVYNITESSLDSLTSLMTAIVLFLTVAPLHPPALAEAPN